MMRSFWHNHEINSEHKIVFLIDDANQHGTTTITNDAENVLHYIKVKYGNDWRVVYKDTDDEWWEIYQLDNQAGSWARFKRWHGLVWDILNRDTI